MRQSVVRNLARRFDDIEDEAVAEDLRLVEARARAAYFHRVHVSVLVLVLADHGFAPRTWIAS